MVCTNCGEQLAEGTTTCPKCGQQLTMAGGQSEINAPVMVGLKCTSCGSEDLRITGLKGALGKSIGVTAMFGALGNLVASSSAEGDTTISPIQYKCNSCKNKFESMPLKATPDQILSAPCTITFERKGSFVGAAVVQFVYLNGIKVGPVKNGKTITFQTYTIPNTLFVTDHNGVAFADRYDFSAQPGGNVKVLFNRKFL